MYPDLGLLVLRAFVGMVVIAHGLQKFGFLGGYGVAGTAGWLESIGFAPGRIWVWIVAIAEVGGGTLTVLGLGGPIGPGRLCPGCVGPLRSFIPALSHVTRPPRLPSPPRRDSAA